MTTGKSPDQLQGIFRITDSEIQVTQIIFLIKTEVVINSQGLMKGFNRQYLPNYNNYQPSTLGSIPGQDLSTTLIDLANIQSRSLEIMVANQRSQQEDVQWTD